MLNEKQKRFCEEYIKDLNGKQAAIRAGYSKKTANEQASRLLRNVNVEKYLKSLREEQKIECIISANEVIKELAKIGKANITDILDFDNDKVTWKDSKKIDTTAIAEVTITPRGRKIKMHSKVSALLGLLQHLGVQSNGLNPDELTNLKQLAAKQAMENM